VDRLTGLLLLRWRLEWRGLRAAPERGLGLLVLLPLLTIASLASAVAVFVGARVVEHSRPELMLPAASALATLIGVFWALSPLITGLAAGETHDLTRVLQFPIPLPTLVVSSLLANLVQPLVVVRLPMLLALALALAASAWRLPAALLGVSLSFAVMLAADHLAGLAIQGMARNRRWRDVLLFVGLGLGLLVSTLPFLIFASGGRAVGTTLRFFVRGDGFALSPFAWGVRAAIHAGRGELAPCLGQLALGSGAVLSAIGLAVWATARLYRGELDIGGPGSAKGTRARMLLPGRVGALVEKDLRTAWRDPALRASLLTGLVGPLLFLFLVSQMPGVGGSPGGLLLIASIAGVTGLGGAAFALERRALPLLLGLPLPRFQLLVAKNLASLGLRTPGLAMFLLVALLLAPLSMLPAVATALAASALVALGLDNYLSILFPVVAPGVGRSPYSGSAAGARGLGAALVALGSLAAAVAISAPFVFLAWLPVPLGRPALWLVSLPLGLAGAAAVYGMLVAGAAGLLSRREPELLARVLSEE